MKKLVTAVVLAALVATPAFAAKKRHTISQQAAAAQAYAPGDQYVTAGISYVVISNGRVVGQDPDPNVRLNLLRDPYTDAP
jgi:hypothetical protein